LRAGVADHLGWATVVTVSADHEVVDRRRIELVEPGVPNMPVHHDSKALDDAATAALVAEVRASIRRATARALDQLARDLPAPVRSLSLRTWPADFPTDVAVLRRVPWEARADAVMYREELAALAARRGWAVHRYDTKRVVDEATAHLGPMAVDVLDGVRDRLGPPWTKDHRTALAAAITAG